MKTWMEKMIAAGWTAEKSASPEMIAHAEAGIGDRMPESYKEFLSWSDGAEGYLGPAYLRLLGCNDLVRLCKDYEVSEYLPGYVLIGNDGGDCFYFMRSGVTHDKRVFMFLSGAFSEDEAEEVGSSFTDFVLRL